jgi:HlyD family secretion protein
VVTYDVILDFANPDLKLFPGMTAYVTIPVATVQNALKLPNAALRYRPPLRPEAIRALYQKYGLSVTESRQPGHGSVDATAGLARAPQADNAIVWKLRADNTLEPVQLALGITDHAYTEVTKLIRGALQEGEEVVTGSVTARIQAPGAPGIRR